MFRTWSQGAPASCSNRRCASLGTWTSRPAERFRSLRGPRRAALAAAVAATIVAGAFFLSRTSLLDARGVDVSGARHVHRAEIVAIAGASKDTNVPWFDQLSAERRLEAEPWIAKAEVSASFTLTIRIA